MPAHPVHKSRSIATKAAELAVAVPHVVFHRVTRMALAGPVPSARDRKEFQLMVEEKNAAFSQAWSAMAIQSAQANQALALSFLRSFWSPSLLGKTSASSMAAQLHSAALGVLDKGLAPVHRKAVANARRLSKTRLR